MEQGAAAVEAAAVEAAAVEAAAVEAARDEARALARLKLLRSLMCNARFVLFH
jgi:hypothetical protein